MPVKATINTLTICGNPGDFKVGDYVMLSDGRETWVITRLAEGKVTLRRHRWYDRVSDWFRFKLAPYAQFMEEWFG